ncbi:hypothetical protein B0H11DRAFT_2013240 [Mycena galericulata]|nr:hypothetical protein B0H11DRAFT_2013240 [Mycena galericulata]
MALKRPLSSEPFAELPNLNQDTYLQVFTHKSVLRADQDNERLSVLGEKCLQMLLMDALLHQRPMLTICEITTRRKLFFSSGSTIPLLARYYGLLDRILCHPNKRSALDVPEEARSILYAYAGGIFVDHGERALWDVVQTWMRLLPTQSSSSSPPLKKIKLEPGVDVQSRPTKMNYPPTTEPLVVFAQPSSLFPPSLG